ncbi:MAG: flagellar basal body rod protein FlgB [Pseudomonadota bacterium]|jgi:flagellar basal-body rod protein FlgB
MDLDAYLGVSAPALRIRGQRTEQLAVNLANAETPGYKARDIDFSAALSAATGGNPNFASSEAFLKYRTPLAPSLDGNTVDVQLEQSAFAENSVRYQATLSFLSGSFRSLITAITGQ